MFCLILNSKDSEQSLIPFSDNLSPQQTQFPKMIFYFISMMQKSRNPTAEAYAGQWGLPTHHKRPYKLFYGFIQYPISFAIFQVFDKQV